MDITKKMLSIPALIAASFLTYIKTLPWLLIFYFLPAMFLVAMINPSMRQFMDESAKLAQMGATSADLAMAFSVFAGQPFIIFISACFFILFIYNSILSYLLNESFLNPANRGVFMAIISSITCLPRYILVCFLFFCILAIFIILPLLPAAFFDLPLILKILVGVLWVFCLLFALGFAFTSLFFTRAAVLRQKGPSQVFIYSAKIVKANIAKLIVYLGLVMILTWAASVVVQTFIAIPFSILINLFNLNADAALLPFTVICNGLVVFFPITALTVYFLNTDYVINYDRNKMECYSRVSGINDSTMPQVR